MMSDEYAIAVSREVLKVTEPDSPDVRGPKAGRSPTGDVGDLLTQAGRVAVVTGASRGIGAATAALLAQAGARVALIARSKEGLAAVAATLPRARSLAIPADLADTDAVTAAVDRIAATWGTVDILVNNAGIIAAAAYRDISVEEWQSMLEVNLTGAFRMVKAVAPLMEAAGWGRIVNITSVTAQTGGVSGGAHYSASKGGLESFTKTLARDLAPAGITVNAIAPGQIDTSPGLLTPEQRERVTAMIPLGRLGAPDDIARAVLFLVSGLADYITGTTLDVNGGILKR
jgi:NAD(P)-dependent dehydrogenase (short-subunit alcohol dehydrogenase family)